MGSNREKSIIAIATFVRHYDMSKTWNFWLHYDRKKYTIVANDSSNFNYVFVTIEVTLLKNVGWLKALYVVG